MADENHSIRVYTTAGRINDLHSTQVLNPKAGLTSTGHDVRLVAIAEEDYQEQLKIYVSNLFAVMDEQEWRIEQQFGNVTALQESA